MNEPKSLSRIENPDTKIAYSMCSLIRHCRPVKVIGINIWTVVSKD